MVNISTVVNFFSRGGSVLLAIDGRLARAAGLIAIFTLFSRILGFIRESLAGRLFTRFETDAYFAAFTVPDFMFDSISIF